MLDYTKIKRGHIYISGSGKILLYLGYNLAENVSKKYCFYEVGTYNDLMYEDITIEITDYTIKKLLKRVLKRGLFRTAKQPVLLREVKGLNYEVENWYLNNMLNDETLPKLVDNNKYLASIAIPKEQLKEGTFYVNAKDELYFYLGKGKSQYYKSGIEVYYWLSVTFNTVFTDLVKNKLDCSNIQMLVRQKRGLYPIERASKVVQAKVMTLQPDIDKVPPLKQIDDMYMECIKNKGK